MNIENLHIHLLPSPQDFPGEALESLNIKLAEDAVRRGEPIPADTYTNDTQHTYSLRPQPEVQQANRATDELLTLLIARSIQVSKNFTVALKQDGFAGGPYLNVVRHADHIEATLISNYRKLEPKENWFSAVLSLFEWTNFNTGVLTTRLYRKVWPATFSSVDVAISIAEVMTYVLNAHRGDFWVFTSLPGTDPLLSSLPDNIFWINPAFDSTFAAKVTQETREHGMIPQPTSRSVANESNQWSDALDDAIVLAEMADDELGIMSLNQLRRDLMFRDGYVNELRLSVIDFLREL